MEQLIANLLCGDDNLVKQAWADLQESSKHPETILLLRDIVSNKEPEVRCYSALMLKKNLRETSHWEVIPSSQKEIIKQVMLNALDTEQDAFVRSTIEELVGMLAKLEADMNDPWMNDVFQLIYHHCISADPKQREIGSSMFATITELAPDLFAPHMESVSEIFIAGLVATETCGNMPLEVNLNIFSGMAYLVPFIMGHIAAEQTFEKSIPLVITSLLAFGVQLEPEQFERAFKFLEKMADYTPKLLANNIKLLLDFCLEASHNSQLNHAVRAKTVYFIRSLVHLEKELIIKHIEPIIQVVFILMAKGPDEDEGEEYLLDAELSIPMTAATQTMDLLALNVHPEKLIPPLWQLLEPALQSQVPLTRRAAYASMSIIAQRYQEDICNKYLETFPNIVKVGITDSEPFVRNAAFYALGQFLEYLQPDITKFAPDIFPILFEFLQRLCNEWHYAEGVTVDKMFSGLEIFCTNLEDALVPYLPILMERLLGLMNHNPRDRGLALEVFSATAKAPKQNMIPYFQQLFGILQTYLPKTEDVYMHSLRAPAIDALATIVRTIGEQNFMPLADDTISSALVLLEEADDPAIRRSLHNLIASLAEVVNENATNPKIMERLCDSIREMRINSRQEPN